VHCVHSLGVDCSSCSYRFLTGSIRPTDSASHTPGSINIIKMLSINFYKHKMLEQCPFKLNGYFKF